MQQVRFAAQQAGGSRPPCRSQPDEERGVIPSGAKDGFRPLGIQPCPQSSEGSHRRAGADPVCNLLGKYTVFIPIQQREIPLERDAEAFALHLVVGQMGIIDAPSAFSDEPSEERCLVLDRMRGNDGESAGGHDSRGPLRKAPPDSPAYRRDILFCHGGGIAFNKIRASQQDAQ